MSEQSTTTPRTEVARRGEGIYALTIRPIVERENDGRIVAININSGTYAIGDSVLEACKRLRANCPDAVIWCVRVGFRTVYRFGGKRLVGKISP